MQARHILPLAVAFGLGLDAAPLLACNRDRVALTCDAARIQPASYGLVTRGAALASSERYDFWEQFDVDSPGRPITSTDEALAFAAQRAVELDVTNQIAHATSARELLILGRPEMAEAAWHRVIENQGAVVWPATLAGRDDILVEFDRQDLRIYSRAQVQQTLGASSEDAVWAALGGCIDTRVSAAAIVSWLNVRAIQNEKNALSFRLREPITIALGGRTKKMDSLSLRLRGLSRGDRGPAAAAAPGCPPDTVRRMLTKLVDPERRIALPVSN